MTKSACDDLMLDQSGLGLLTFALIDGNWESTYSFY